MHSIVANLDLSQDVAKERKKEIDSCSHKVANFYTLQQAAEMRRYGSLININPSAIQEALPLS